MGFFDELMLTLDRGVTGFLGQWNGFSTAIVGVLVLVVSCQLFTRRDPDTHPLLLARQAQASSVRQEGESAVYRAHAAPHGMPLDAGLGIKDPGASRWSRGRDGDLRDIWRQAVAGVQDEGANQGTRGKLLTMLGTERVVEHDLDDVTRQINLIGQHVLDQGGNRVAIYLPNSVELLAALFACSFYNLTAIVLPFGQPNDAILSMIRRSAADTVITVPGAFPFDAVVKSYPALRQLIWVVDDGSRHMDWNEVPQGVGGAVNVATWQDIVADSPADAGKQLPPREGQSEARDVTVFWQAADSGSSLEEMVRFTSANLVAAVAGQLHALPSSQRLSPTDVFLPADSLANTHALALTLAALYANASVAFNSVADKAGDLATATRGPVVPTVVVATPAALLKTRAQAQQALAAAPLARAAHWAQTRSLTQSGAMPAASSWVSAYYRDCMEPKPRATAGGETPARLRLIYTAERAGSASAPPLSSADLSDLRVCTGARVVYALTAAKVAGAAAQTGLYDYRVGSDSRSHFGAPLTCTEIYLRDMGSLTTTDAESRGEIVVRGPSVAGGEAALGVAGVIQLDNTLAYA